MSEIDRFQTRTPWKPLRHSPLQEAAWQFLATMSLVFGLWYISWRWTSSLNFDALWFAVPLLMAETAAFVGLVLFTINLWTSKSPPQQPPPATIGDCMDGADSSGTEDRPLAVDVFFATYSEDPELVRLGLRDAKLIEYPHPIDLRVHVLDDGKRPEMAEVARQEGANYLTRDDNVGFKAGNLRNAMGMTSGDFVVICDADTRPFPTLLVETLGYFRDPKVAWVQTPQWFCDVPPGVPLDAVMGRWAGRAGGAVGRGLQRLFGPMRIGEDPFANDPQMFFDVILRRRNWANASFCCGAGSIHRREAVMEAALRQWADKVEAAAGSNERAARRLTGEAALDESIRDAVRWQGAVEEEFTPYKFHVSEDIYTSIVLHSDRERGWKSVLHPKVQSRMLSPNDLLSWTIQRFKYAGGTVDILIHDNPLFRRGLTLPQKIMYGVTFYSYLSPLWNVVFLAAPIVFLFTGIRPVSAYSLDFFLHITAFLLLNEMSQLVATWGISNAKGRAWYLAMFPLNMKALWTVFRGRKISFPVTPKERQAGSYPRLVRWQIGVVAVTGVGLAWGWTAHGMGIEGYTLGAMIANTLWGGNNMLSMLPMIRAAFWQPDPVYEAPILAEATK
ncbi:glycosyltransferase family 2 protein [Lutibaculum baratangense]|uniref:Cellulose synthase (UDP-forming) n=1 Tax=Lutibaculum baratangense AMV1 TaxID=631454 RepID=V4TN73_9HYPH|nr:cellulose synthase catalytic subunit [Lutibaculum baratangense]ESR27173.1 Cellulose synthase (UDP-forming) [Lutibaculum baratangense AMV1]